MSSSGAGAVSSSAFEVGDNCQIAANAVTLSPWREQYRSPESRETGQKDDVPVKDPSKKNQHGTHLVKERGLVVKGEPAAEQIELERP